MTVFALTLGFFTVCLGGRAVAQQGHDFRICEGDFALCAASTCQPTGGKITVNVIGGGTATFPEYNCTCPIFDGPAIADLDGGNMDGSCTPPHDQIWSLYQPRSQIPQAITNWSRLPSKSSAPPLVCGATSIRATSWSIALASPVIPAGKSGACRLQPVIARSANRWTARQWSRVPPSGRRRVRGIRRSASITRLADRSHPLREPGHRREKGPAGIGGATL